MKKLDCIDKKEVLRYLGCKTDAPCDALTDEKIEQGISIALDAAMVRAVHVCLDIKDLKRLALLEGRDIEAHLDGCDRAVLLAVTIGSEIEKKIRNMQLSDVLMPVVLDACATVCVEKAADEYCDELCMEYGKKGLYLTERFSPGYGDFPLEKQSALLRIVDAQRKIGLCVTESSILTPRKSVTAIMGVSNEPRTGKLVGCTSCALREKCEFRKKGEFCNV